MSSFSLTRDFNKIAWKTTFLVNLERSFVAGIIWFCVALLSGEPLLATTSEELGAWPFLFFPLVYFIFLLPAGLVYYFLAGLLSGCGFFIGLPVWLCGILVSLSIAVADPILFVISKIKPEIVPVEDYSFISLNLIIFVLKSEGQQTKQSVVEKFW